MGLISRVSSRTYRRFQHQPRGVNMGIDHADGHQFNHSWSTTVLGAIHKYPNSVNTNVKCVDVLSRKLDDCGNLATEKLLVVGFTPNTVMRKVMSLIGMPITERQLSLEISKLDLTKKSYLMRTLNDTHARWISVYETLNYTPDDSDSDNKTFLDQTTHVDMYVSKYSVGIQWALRAGENAFVKQVKSNVPRGRMGLESVIEGLYHDFEELAKEAKSLTKEQLDKAEALAKEQLDKAEALAKEQLAVAETIA